MSTAEFIKYSCEQILSSVRCSNLNFSSTETPYSLYLTIRKSIPKNFHPRECSSQASKGVLSAAVCVDNSDLKATEQENQQLKKLLSEAKDQVTVT